MSAIKFEALVPRSTLASALWYSDGSGVCGANWGGLDMGGTPEDWRLVHIALAGESVFLRFERCARIGDPSADPLPGVGP